ncbi:hypothetical protein ACFO4L_09435 [Bacillus daqingensis]|uniref:Uncharacterized protein n=1 Tax=Bacillus daqingensis TaxID=872396 RepID=A0ABV9NY06_9BACI
MEITTITFQPTSTRRQLYYPYLLSVWRSSYRTLFSPQTEKRALMTNLVKGGTSFAVPPHTTIMKALPRSVMTSAVSFNEAEEDAFEMLRRFYLHKARSWKIPDITLQYSTLVYVPFEYYVKQTRWLKKDALFLYEPLSNSEEPLKKHPEILEHVSAKEAIG